MSKVQTALGLIQKGELHEASELIKESLSLIAQGAVEGVRTEVAESFKLFKKKGEKDDDSDDDDKESDDKESDDKESDDKDDSDDEKKSKKIAESDDEDEDDDSEESEDEDDSKE